MTQRDIDELANLLNEVNKQLIMAKDKIEMQERIIKSQEDMIDILKNTIQNRDKIIDALETQIALAERHIKLQQQ